MVHCLYIQLYLYMYMTYTCTRTVVHSVLVQMSVSIFKVSVKRVHVCGRGGRLPRGVNALHYT